MNTWMKSSFSTGANTCVGVRAADISTHVTIGDTKDPDGPTITVSNEAWDRFVAEVAEVDQVAEGAASFTGRLQPEFLADGGFRLHDTGNAASPKLWFTQAEWDAFHAGVQAGELRAETLQR